VGTIESTKAKSMISLSFNMNVLHETIRKEEQTKNKSLKAKIKKQQIDLFKCLFLFTKSFIVSKKTSTFQLIVDNIVQSCGHL
jgi:DNA repair protein RadC